MSSAGQHRRDCWIVRERESKLFRWWQVKDGSLQNTISIVPFLSGVPQLYTANLDVARQVVAGPMRESAWFKSPRVAKALLYVLTLRPCTDDVLSGDADQEEL